MKQGTFSAFGLQSFELFSAGHAPKAILYISLSLTLGILAVFFGHSLTSRLLH